MFGNIHGFTCVYIVLLANPTFRKYTEAVDGHRHTADLPGVGPVIGIDLQRSRQYIPGRGTFTINTLKSKEIGS